MPDTVEPPGDTAAIGPAGLESVLVFLRDRRGFDFTGYKRSTLQRRVRRRMQATRCADHGEYLDLLEVEAGEANELFNTLLINVSSFFRDPELWEELERSVVPRLLARATPESPVRVWSAGCADGQEPYSVAMLFAEAIGQRTLRDLVKIYATDIDEDALSSARRGVYPARALEQVPPERRARWFEPADEADPEGDQVFSPELRRCVIFGRHNLIEDAPISRVDLLLCRNTLMYLNADLQRHVARRLHFSLAPGGLLALGRVEMLLGDRALFEPLDAEVRLLTRRSPGAGRGSTFDAGADVDDTDRPLSSLAFRVSPVPQVVVDRAGVLAAVNDAARQRFDLRPGDVGAPFHELELSYRPVELRSRIDQALEDLSVVVVEGVQERGPGGDRYLDAVVTPLLVDEVDGPVGALVAFVDVTRTHELESRVQEVRNELETAYEELQSTNEELETTNEELQSTNEELETTNEELQSTIEELETTNEELRSTNEEFETMNDELQAVNDELAVRNNALRERSAELATAREYFRSVFDSMHAGLAVVDTDLRILTWNTGADELWGVRPEEAQGRTLLGLDIGLPVEQLAAPIREVFAGGVPAAVELSSHNRRGRPLRCRVECAPLRAATDGEITGAILLMVAED